ncbi:nitrate- and nitrite sensing domain-containing protein [Desulfurobacterium atlanticum]|uniref:Nitrate and nitrite sensing n=1 Tax=Desulfurobacterium atlanticum TaxID=240169 RepID=A0A238ZTP9_9BACT|nr:nitrate- and nitrite sensing domain-containing protein [Desulfurobacterium atlanticum]SNR86715.1 Nitrate and nitrite sensing [Desulfurobacterium atlanticum]
MRSLSLKVKLFLILTISLMAFLLNFTFIIHSTYKEYKTAKIEQEYTIMAKSLIELIHEIAKERGLSTVYVASRRDFFKNKMLIERNILDGKLVKFEDSLKKSNLTIAKKITEILQKEKEKLYKIRNKTVIDAERTNYVEVFNFYSGLIESLYTFFKNSKILSGNFEHEIYPLDRLKNIEGKLRAFIAVGLATKIDNLIIQKINEYCNEKKLIFTSHITEDLNKILQRRVYKTPIGIKIHQIITKLKNGEKVNITPEEWWKIKTRQIDELYKIELNIIDHTLKTISTKQEILRKRLIGEFFFLFYISCIIDNSGCSNFKRCI